jgi:phosphoribosylformimino-5-aminoimidazole carboxamide ribotide isomerase
MEIIPAVDVLDGTVVRLARGDYRAVTRYEPDPVATAVRWSDEGARRVHVVDLQGARTGDPDRELWGALAAAGVAFQVGGGLRTVEAVETAIAAGAERAVVGTAAVWSPEVLSAMVDAVGSERIVVALDVRAGRATGSGWEDDGRDLDGVIARFAGAGVIRALVTGISHDGMMTGPDLDLLAVVRSLAPDLRLIGSGGVGSLQDLTALAGAGVEAAIVGRALYEGRFSLEDAIAACG